VSKTNRESLPDGVKTPDPFLRPRPLFGNATPDSFSSRQAVRRYIYFFSRVPAMSNSRFSPPNSAAAFP
jgi:hypothetical protein